jgi:hypothetical protein
MENWKSIIGFEGLYEVSNYGNVRSIQRSSENKGSFSGKINIKGKILKQTKNRLGYHVLTLFKAGERNFKIVHRLVAESFIANERNLKEVNHKDFNKSNNSVENLEWCSRLDNMAHFYNSKQTTSNYKGVSYQKERNKWISYVDINKKRTILGRFNTEIEAHKKRIDYINKLKTINYEELI